MQRLVDLREILRYVPQYRDKIFVIAIDGAIVEDDNFRNLLLDITLLRSLRIAVALVHGAGWQVRRLAEQVGLTASNDDGTGVTDSTTLQLALHAANRVTHEILEGLSATDLRGAAGNFLVAHPAGILPGVDYEFTGRIERVDVPFLQALFEHDIVPVIPPLGCDGEGNTFRLNSDAVAVEVARALGAVKLIYLTTVPGIVLPGGAEEGLVRHMTAEEAESVLKKHKNELGEPSLSKLTSALRALKGGVPRVHIVDGRVQEGVLSEVFSNVGIGTLVHTNEYQAIRRAQRRDARGIYTLIRAGVESDELLSRTLSDIEGQVGDFFVFDVDGNLAACVALHAYPDTVQAEMACVCVAPQYENQGIGLRLMHYVEEQARQRGVKTLFCLSTQAANYFIQKGGFRAGTADDLPAPRRQRYEASGRHSKILTKALFSAP
jgi:amino-acid N-acetyltransferase